MLRIHSPKFFFVLPFRPPHKYQTVRYNRFSRQSIFPAQIQWHFEVPSVITDRDLVKKRLCIARVWVNLWKSEGLNKTSVTLSHSNNLAPRSELEWLRSETYLSVTTSLATQEVILHWSPRLGLNYSFSGCAQLSDRTECIHWKAFEEEKETNSEPVCLARIAIWKSWKSTFCCTERRHSVPLKENRKSQAQVFSGYGFNQKEEKSGDFIYLVSRQVASKAQSYTLCHLFSHLPSLSALQQPEASWKTMSTLKCESSRRRAASELKQGGVNKQAAWMSTQPSAGPSDSSCDIVCPAVTAVTASSMSTLHRGAPPSRGRQAIKICSASAQN